MLTQAHKIITIKVGQTSRLRALYTGTSIPGSGFTSGPIPIPPGGIDEDLNL